MAGMAAPSQGCWTQILPHPIPEPPRRAFAYSPGDWPGPARSIPSPGKYCWRQDKVRASPRTDLSAEVAQGSRRVWKVEGRHKGDSHLSKWFPTTTSFSSTMLGCWSCRSRVISRRLLMGIPGGGRNSRAVRTAWSQSQDRAAPVPPPTSITIFLVVHPHLLQCHCLVRQRVPGTVWGQHRPRWHHTHTSGFVPTPPRPPQPSRRGGTG